MEVEVVVVVVGTVSMVVVIVVVDGDNGVTGGSVVGLVVVTVQSRRVRKMLRDGGTLKILMSIF